MYATGLSKLKAMCSLSWYYFGNMQDWYITTEYITTDH